MEKVIVTNENDMEIILHGTTELPLKVSDESILNYKNNYFNCHWHKEIELTYVYEGEMLYQANNHETLLSAGDCSFVNSKALHLGSAIDGKPCHYKVITFNPDLLGVEETAIQKKYVQPILNCNKLSLYLFKADNEWENKIVEMIKKIIFIYEEKTPCYEIEITALLINIWGVFYQNTKSILKEEGNNPKSIDYIKNVVTFIRENFSSKISLEDMAKSANISKSECNHSFKRYMKETPFEYLLRYRVERSMVILLKENVSITEIALAVGFSNASYYSEVFKRYVGVTPREYKKLGVNK